MRLRLVVLIALSLVAAGGAAYMTQSWLNAERQAAAKPAPKPRQLTAKVLVAAEDLGAGTILKSQHLRWQVWPEDGLTDSYIARGNGEAPKLEGAVVRQSMSAGEPITEQRVVRPGDRGFLAAMLSPGTRAISVPVNAASGVAGLIYPGDRVDLVLTHQVSGKKSADGTPRRASETVLHDIRILALDQRTDDQENKREVAKIATIEVTPKQVEKISVAMQLGKLSLSLRPIARKEERDVDSVTYTVDSEVSAVLAGAGPKTSAGPPPKTVTVVRGGSVEELSFQEN